MVFQDPYGSLHPRHTIGDILEEPLQIHRFNDRDRRINALLDKVGLNRAFASAIRISSPAGSGSAWR
jgi:peptide/nickel transport system ATP-binding protein